MKMELREENAALRNEVLGLKSQLEGLHIECQSLVKQLNIYQGQDVRHQMLSQTRSAKYLHNNSYWQ
jgi:FtsZ-binding cell division protein ZapB